MRNSKKQKKKKNSISMFLTERVERISTPLGSSYLPEENTEIKYAKESLRPSPHSPRFVSLPSSLPTATISNCLQSLLHLYPSFLLPLGKREKGRMKQEVRVREGKGVGGKWERERRRKTEENEIGIHPLPNLRCSPPPHPSASRGFCELR